MTVTNCLESLKSTEAMTEDASIDELLAGQCLTVENLPGLLGVLLGLRNLMPLTTDASITSPDTAFQLKGSFGAKVAETDTHVDIALILRVSCVKIVIRYS